MGNPFAYIEAVSFSKKDLIRESEEAEGEYKPFLTNRALSNFPDSIFYANEMNQRAHIGNTLQYDYFINTLPKRKRFAKWAKPTKDEDLEVVMEYYSCGRATAEQYLRTLTADDITMIYDKFNKGGVKNERKNDRRSSGDPPKEA